MPRFFGVTATVAAVAAEEWSNAQIIEAVRDPSNDDPQAADIARAALRNGLPPDDSFAELTPEMKVFATLSASLGGSGRMVSLDRKEELSECEAAFTALFAKAGLDVGEATAQLANAPSDDNGDVGTAYVVFCRVADTAGMRIVGLNADSDMYHFVLTSVERAQRWMSVSIGPNQYIEDPDWQFPSHLEAAQIGPRSAQHPSRTERGQMIG